MVYKKAEKCKFWILEVTLLRPRATYEAVLHQEQKLAQSGLGDLFNNVHIVSEKHITTYQRIFGAQLAATAMVGNSIKSDILPALAAGAAAIHIPGRYEWEMDGITRLMDKLPLIEA